MLHENWTCDSQDTQVNMCTLISVSSSDANPIIKESFAKQLLRSKRQERPMKAGHPDEPMREHMLHMQALDQRAQETNMEHWLNPHCPPRCDRNYGYPV
uniref:Si:dkey-31g6.6 n=1 Tax=Acanthochromis polyacanthus TaxID=80966 RepID=A0A3Q1G3R2_9TELE